MPPHCDTRDGPVVQSCRKALETGNVNYALIWIPSDAEPELMAAFEKTMRVRSAGGEARDLADDWFFETAVRLHRASEGEPFTGLKPAGLDEGRLSRRRRERSRPATRRQWSTSFATRSTPTCAIGSSG